MLLLVVFQACLRPLHSILTLTLCQVYFMTWNRGHIVNTTRTIVPFQEESSKTFEGCSTMLEPVHPLYGCSHYVLIGILDMMTTDSSSSPFTQDELAAILDLVNSLKGTFS